jgi:hypothetical protein
MLDAGWSANALFYPKTGPACSSPAMEINPEGALVFTDDD